ncbi:MAG: peptide chain release factor N(5)-glutamine methyltransferase [Planctomycetes bacterium]|nr:peptide chain release factor N(5)-glutamine methyltransferase [Planctomycetota bacterium]
MSFDPVGRQQAVQERLLAAKRVLEGAGIADAGLEVEMLFAAAAGILRKQIVAGYDSDLSPQQAEVFQNWLQRRCDGEPVAYLEGWQGFYGLEFEVNRHVLIPRADSECLVDSALEFIAPTAVACIADLGTGSGCLLQATLSQRPNCRGIAVDKSADALRTARRNAAHLGLTDRIRFVQASWLESLANNCLHAILCNPPYVHPSEPVGPGVADFEPTMALFTPPEDAYSEYRQVLKRATDVLKTGGRLFFEVGFGRAQDVVGLSEEAGLDLVRVVKDLAGVERLVELQRN